MMIRKLRKKPLCKKCKKNLRVSLYFCKKCKEEHNKQTKSLKRKYRKEGKCVMCGKKSKTRMCIICREKNNKSIKNSSFSISKKAKKGLYGGLKQLEKII